MLSNSSRYETIFSIYVAGIPKRTSRGELLAYFTTFGSIKAVHTFNSGEPSLYESQYYNPKLVKGYCIVETTSAATYGQILDFQQHSLFGRPIVCEKYEAGSKLMRQNRLNNQRRVILTGVPPHVELETLRELLDSIGNLEILYEFKTNSVNPSFSERNTENNYKSFSAMFKDKDVAQMIIKIGHLNLGTFVVQAEKFKPAKKRSKFDIQQTEMPGAKIRASVVNPINTFASTIESRHQKGPFLSYGQVFDFIKPTSKAYHEKRVAILDSKPVPAHLINLRLNRHVSIYSAVALRLQLT